MSRPWTGVPLDTQSFICLLTHTHTHTLSLSLSLSFSLFLLPLFFSSSSSSSSLPQSPRKSHPSLLFTQSFSCASFSIPSPTPSPSSGYLRRFFNRHRRDPTVTDAASVCRNVLVYHRGVGQEKESGFFVYPKVWSVNTTAGPLDALSAMLLLLCFSPMPNI